MVEWCDVAQCYKWLNSRSHEKYSNLNAWFTIPAIVLSTISEKTSTPLGQQYLPLCVAKGSNLYSSVVIIT